MKGLRSGRSLERAWRLVWMRLIAAALPGPRTARVPNWSTRPWRVLYVRYERIGDMIMATSMIRALATAHDTITLDVLATPANAPVLDGNPYVSAVLEFDRRQPARFVKFARELHRRTYDVVVDGRINNPRIFVYTPMVMLASSARYRIGAAGGLGDQIYNVRVRPFDRADLSTHYIDASAHLAEPFGVQIEEFDWRPELFLRDEERRSADARWGDDPRGLKRFLVNLSASEPKRRWPDERFVEVVRSVASPEMRIAVIGLPNEWDRVRAVAASVSGVAVPTPSVRDAFAMVGTSDVVFTPDTSISHAAAAFRKPAVVLLKRDHASYGPYRLEGTTVFWDGDRIDALPVPPVLAAVRELVSRYPGG
jgi:ADP-heptose:LPS heptosyltransferase